MRRDDPADLLLTLGAVTTVAILALTEQYPSVAGGVVAYGTAWLFLRPHGDGPG